MKLPKSISKEGWQMEIIITNKKELSIGIIQYQRPTVLPKPKILIDKALGTILSAFEDTNQMEVVKVRWEQIKKLQIQPAVVKTL